MLLYSKRKNLVRIYEKWIKDNCIGDCPESVIAFLYIHELINVEKAFALIEKEGNKNEKR